MNKDPHALNAFMDHLLWHDRRTRSKGRKHTEQLIWTYVFWLKGNNQPRKQFEHVRLCMPTQENTNNTICTCVVAGLLFCHVRERPTHSPQNVRCDHVRDLNYVRQRLRLALFGLLMFRNDKMICAQLNGLGMFCRGGLLIEGSIYGSTSCLKYAYIVGIWTTATINLSHHSAIHVSIALRLNSPRVARQQ
jgi:hypothetical protein